MSGHFHLRGETLRNIDYRRVLWTTKYHQLVLMCLLPGEDIPSETHENTSQFIRIEQGKALIYVDGTPVEFASGDAADISPGSIHRVVNSDLKESLLLYTVYSPPEHQEGLVLTRQPLN